VTAEGFTSDACWGGRPVARRIADACPRYRLVVTGTITAIRVVELGESYGLRCELDDDTGQVALVFVGRAEIPGVVKGARCTVEGTARQGGDNQSELEVWNPLYRFEPQ
jgi:hypothetical protein